MENKEFTLDQIRDGIKNAGKTPCLRCNCLPSECRSSDTPYDCPNCTWTHCDCWAENNELQ